MRKYYLSVKNNKELKSLSYKIPWSHKTLIMDRVKDINQKSWYIKETYNNDFHDRFIIIDRDLIYHLGASLNNAGNKVFAINVLEEKEIKEVILKKIDTLFNVKI